MKLIITEIKMNQFTTNLNSHLHGVTEVVKHIVKEYEKVGLKEIEDLVKKGLIVVKSQGFSIYQDHASMGLVLADRVSFELKDQEYITKLEQENKELREKLDNIEQAFIRKG
jgi:ABC-type sulfate transport system substrate-binding protein